MTAENISFFALLHRMRYINRWGLMRNAQTENLQEHTLDVAILAHALAIIRRQRFAEADTPDPAEVVLYALYHDVTEIITGDLPTPVKYYNNRLRADYGEIEEQAAECMLSFLPEDLQSEYRTYLQPDYRSLPAIKEIVKAADILSAYIKCQEEIQAGNHDFIDASKQIEAKLASLNLPEVDYFCRHALPAYGQTLDRLSHFTEDNKGENHQKV